MCVLRSGHLTKSPPPSGPLPTLPRHPQPVVGRKKNVLPLKVKQVRGCSCKTTTLLCKNPQLERKDLFTRPPFTSLQKPVSRPSCTGCPPVHRVDSAPLNTAADTAPAHFTSQLSFKVIHTPTHTSLSLRLFSTLGSLTCLGEKPRQPWTRKPCSPVLPPLPCTALHWSIRPRLVRIPTQLRPVPPSVHLYAYNINTLFVSWM